MELQIFRNIRNRLNFAGLVQPNVVPKHLYTNATIRASGASELAGTRNEGMVRRWQSKLHPACTKDSETRRCGKPLRHYHLARRNTVLHANSTITHGQQAGCKARACRSARLPRRSSTLSTARRLAKPVLCGPRRRMASISESHLAPQLPS